MVSADEYLKQIAQIDRLIETSCDRIRELREIAVSITVPMDKEKVQSSGTSDLIGNSVARYVDMENDVLSDLLTKKKDIVSKIANMENAEHYDILYNLYVVKVSVKTVCERSGLTERHIWRLRKDALDAFELKYLKDVAECQQNVSKCQ